MDIKKLFKKKTAPENKEREWWEYLLILPGLFLACYIFNYCFYKDMKIVGIVALSTFVAFAILSYALPKRSKITNIVWFIITNGAIVEIGQILNETYTMSEFNRNVLIAGVMFVFAIPTVLFIITGRFKISTYIGSFLMILLAFANIMVLKFRHFIVFPADIKSIGTAATVAKGYDFDLTPYQIVGLALYALLICMSLLFRDSKFKNQIIFRAVGVVLFGALITAHVMNFHVVNLSTWFNSGPTMHGVYANFYYLTVEEVRSNYPPSGYSDSEIALLEERYPGYTAEELQAVLADDDKPTVIVIMNESFADFRVLGDNFNPSESVTPFFDSMYEDTVRGYALASQNGAGTSISEYEFLSGNNNTFLAAGLTPYQSMIRQSTYALPHVFKDFGYRTYATHPMPAYNWARDSAWVYLGFDELSFLDDYPEKHTVRYYETDVEMYQYIIDRYEERSDVPMFFFGVTMQNHGPYSYENTDEYYEEPIDLVGYSDYYPDAEEYLTRLHMSDDALEYLITYFDSIDKPVVIMMFGDHYPAVSQNLFQEIHGGSFYELDEKELMYTIPFFIWSNYDIEEEYVDIVSFSFMSDYLLEVCGLPLPAYNQFSSDMMEYIPALNQHGFYSINSGCFLPYDSDQITDEEAEFIREYSYLQYNSIYGDRSDVFFSVEE